MKRFMALAVLVTIGSASAQIINPSSGGATLPYPGIVIATSSTGGTALAPVNGDCVVGAGGAWTAATCPGGSGTVTSVSVTTANGVSGSVATATTTPAITVTLGAITPTSLAINGDTAVTAGPRAFMPFATGQLAAIVTSGQYFVGQLVKSGTAENFTATAAAFTCATNPTLTLEDCGATAGTCASPTAIANVTLTAANTVTSGTITSGTLTAGHFFTVETTAGVCTVLNASGSAEYRMN